MRRLSSYENWSPDHCRPEIWEGRRALALLRKGLYAGKAFEVAPHRWELHWQMNCLTPRYVMVTTAPLSYDGRARAQLVIVEATRCRRCEGCMDSAARLWAARACAEFRTWPRTLTVAFTSSAAHDALMDVEVARSNDLSKLTPDQLFAARSELFFNEIQLWLKRVRSAVEYRTGQTDVIRYVMVAERHKKDGVKFGRPHFHGIIYETKSGVLVEGDPVEAFKTMSENGEYTGKYFRDKKGQWQKGCFLTDKSMLRQQWKLGLCKFRVAFTEQDTFYALKYISKEKLYRVTASKLFGNVQFLEKQTANENNEPALAEMLDHDSNSQNG